MTNKKFRHFGMDAEIQTQGCECIVDIAPESSLGVTGKLPSMALNTRVPAGMTTLELLCKNDRLKYNLH
jgi:hypothetical protein